MLPGLTLPPSLRRLVDAFTGCFTTPTFVVFTAMVVGMVAQTGSTTVCGMLAGAGLAQQWSHDRVHRFFARAVWSIDAIGLIVLDLVLTHLLDAGAVIVLAVDDTAHRRRGKKVHGASWIHDGSAPSRNKLAFGHRWVVVGVVVALPFMTRPVCLPVASRRWQGKGSASTVEVACQMVTSIAERLPGRRIHVVADAAYHGTQVRGLPEQVTWTTRLPRNAALYRRAPARTGKRGRPRLKGDKLGTPAEVAAGLIWRAVSVARYGRVESVQTAVIDCLWYGAFGPIPVRMVCVRDRDDPKAPTLALITTDLTATVADVVARYAMRWAVEVTFFDCRQTLGVGQARNRVPLAVERTWAFGMYVYSLVVLWYALHGHNPDVVTERRLSAPWYLAKTDPSFADMLTTLRRTLIAARFMPVRPAQPTDAEIRQVQHAWALAAA
ncbi:transposase [Frankia sp. CiP3]|uniref:IS701 family transposase n=1 Tax=Frankia sp. CiP3 TaxID=2880971 RepID=UPI001EF4CFC0|nr:transposase [Frankia sp. CiP3]